MRLKNRIWRSPIVDDESIQEDSFQRSLPEYNQYTKPREFHGLKVPEVLLSGNHAEIAKFRLEQSKLLTKKKRPDLWGAVSSEDEFL